MRKMVTIGIFLVLGMAASAWILRREIRRAPAEPSVRPELRSVDDWQKSLRLAAPGGYAPTSARDRELFEKLRREEERQRPEEGRN